MSVSTFQSLPTPSSTPPPELEKYIIDESPCFEKRRQPPIPRLQLYSQFFLLVQKYLKELDGRDKSIKIIQYAFKILLHHGLVNPKKWSSMVSSFSMTRKILRLGLAIGPTRKLLLEPTPSLWNSCVLVNEIGNTVADDIYCLYKLGVVNSNLGKRAEIISMYCWFLGIMHDLHENYQSLQQLKANNKPDQQEKIIMTQISLSKLMMDGIFCACDIWSPSFANGVQAWSGFFSGALSGYKLWRKCASSSSSSSS
ncbi:hypothetical protein RO3G_06403 [Lichtheimia corymbifera JMRC:FSU:9682]|uniref:Peroxisomal biogenesis factor 11 n=1 Tax=Lichtheimia corymbifera JMRC:FSU:9682 TaxID=1263082 RepID=A0A068RSP2_9FUNG|nr:hypothetical protein RO3G_06403 [Lichtheimia corymbifera JMRC:FSU:9682]